MKSVNFKEVEHTADWALHVRGKNLADLLLNAAQGMNRLMVSNPNIPARTVTKTIELEAQEAEDLLVDWLSELVYWAETEQLIFNEIVLQQVSSTHLRATIKGGAAPNLEKHIKAVTYHNLEITATASGLEATIVFDV